MGKSDIIQSSDKAAAVAMGDSSDRDDDHTASEEERPDSSSAESGESDSEEGSIGAGALLDLEASESGGEDEQESDDDDDDHDDGQMSAWSHKNHHTFFPQFCRLPIELRQRVWEFFDLDLRAPARVFDVHVVGDCLWPSGTLEQQTEPARTLLEVHRESRQMGLKFYPDTLPILNRKGFMRYHKDRDIIFLGWMTDSMDWESSRWENIAGDLKHVKNLAFEVKPDIHLIDIFGDLPFHHFASLQKVYPCWDAFDLHARNLKWCVSDMVHVFHVETEEQEPGLGEDMEAVYCWPNLEKHPEYAEKEIPKDIRLSRSTNGAGEKGVELWPMVLFSSYDGARRYHRLRAKALTDPDAAWDSESSSESGDESSEEDEYESEGIDDATIDESDEDEAGLDDLVVRDSSDDEDEGGSAFNGFSPQRDVVAFSGVVDLTGDFSSLEPEPPKHDVPDDSDSDEESDPDEEPTRKIKRPRRQVVSSDSEDEPADEPREKPAGKQTRQPNRRPGRVVLSDSDDSDDDDDDNGANTKSKGSGIEESDAAADDDSAEDSDEEEEQEDIKPMSLAERLRLFRSDNPVPQDGLDSGSEDAGGSESFYQDAEDDDGLVEGEAYGDDEDVSGNELVMDMAEEESDGGNEDEW
ncbi:hypothetical protein SLS62_000396 [Diatrype stigma]|uniref:2EXR domain-containing protein n=1 Tax=Diatrype stigma TaxID=117547 RepID=A0AAN9YWU8_9PEZI